MNGFLSENLIKAKLAQSCDIKEDPVYDHRYKLDFIVDRFKDIDKLVHIGVQVTINPNDSAKQAEFLRERKKRTLVDRSVYVKVHPEADIDHWGAELIYNAITAFAFQKDLREKDVIGVRINQDVTYEFFEVAASAVASPSIGLGSPSSAEPAGVPKVGQLLRGRIYRYNKSRGYGFIESEEGKRWFFHFSAITDNDLRENILPNAPADLDTNNLEKTIPVEFEDGGFTRGDAPAPSALNIRPIEAEGNY